MSTTNDQNTPEANREGRDALKAVEPVGKSRRFRLLLPVIIAKIERGVEHAEIIKALGEQGLELTQGTYFSYLNRYRSAAASNAQVRSPAAPNAELPKPQSSQASSVSVKNTSGRPKTFDYDPRGINPDLLK
jgi:hypothetical protein